MQLRIGTGHQPATDLGFELLSPLDAIDRDDAACIVGACPIGEAADERPCGRYRTRDLVLGYMNALAAGGRRQHPGRLTRWFGQRCARVSREPALPLSTLAAA